MDLFAEILSLWMHGGSLLTMFIFIKLSQIINVVETKQKVLLHLMCWGVPFALIQCIHWNFAGEHIYGFIGHMSWPVLIGFELFMLLIAITFDYLFSVLHGVRLDEKIHSLNKVINAQANALTSTS